MRLRLWMVALLVSLAACGSSAASSPPSPGPPPSEAQSSGTPSPSSGTTSGPGAQHCGPAAATTLATGHQARVYSWHGGVFGCSFARGRPFRLGSAARSIREAKVTPVALAGIEVAYGLSKFGIDTVRTDVVVRRLSDSKQLADFPATVAGVVEGFQSVGSLAVKSDGAVAWIGLERSIIGGHRSVIEVRAADAPDTTSRLLDSGPDIGTQSLRLHGSTLTWSHGAATRHATLR
jgi:hypothetical protein